MLRFIAVIAMVVAGPTAIALAQTPANAGDDDEDDSLWSVTVGGGAGARPTYRGASKYKATSMPSGVAIRGVDDRIDQAGLAFQPLVAFDYNDIIFFESGRREIGVRYLDWEDDRYGRLRGSLVGHYKNRRIEEDDDNLRGLDEISRTFFMGGRFTYDYDAFTLKTSITIDVTEQADDAIRGDATLSYAWAPIRDWTFRPRIGIELGDGSYNDTFFGISAREAGQSAAAGVGLAAYDAPAGLTAYSVGVDVDYAITKRFGVTGVATFERLAPAAADSPLVKDVGSANQFSGGVYVSYRF
ncbi:MAG: MipA/OmpV family protein [Pseudomonadota bacterium]